MCIAFDKSNGAGRVLDGVASLIDKSLLQQTGQEGDEPRLVMLETTREYGWEVLAANGELEMARQVHANYYLTFAEKAEPELLDGPQQALWERLEQEHDNLRAALQWLTEHHQKEKALRLGSSLSNSGLSVVMSARGVDG